MKLENGRLYPPIDIFVDARSVSDAISASDVCTPQEAPLRLHLIAVRDRLTRGLIRSISWTDTRDMVADALTKGGVDRALIMQVMNGKLMIHNALQTHRGTASAGPSTVVPVYHVRESDANDEFVDLEGMD